jgi:Cu/Ag efflux protein CusF
MKASKFNHWIGSALLMLLGLASAAVAADKEIHKMEVEDQILVTATATVQELDVEKREVTLKGPLGDISTLKVAEEVKRLNEIKVGDKVTAKYYVSIAGELREPTEEEKKNPIMVVTGTAKAPKTSAPAAGEVNVIRVVATVEGLERPTRLLVLKGPRGKYMSVRARDVKRLEQLHLGDTIVVTFTEALAISVEKEKAG